MVPSTNHLQNTENKEEPCSGFPEKGACILEMWLQEMPSLLDRSHLCLINVCSWKAGLQGTRCLASSKNSSSSRPCLNSCCHLTSSSDFHLVEQRLTISVSFPLQNAVPVYSPRQSQTGCEGVLFVEEDLLLCQHRGAISEL